MENKLQTAGFCCPFGWCLLTQQKATRGHQRTKARTWAMKMVVSEATIFNMRRRFDNGALLCQGLPNCQKGIAEPGKPVDITFLFPGRFTLASDDNWLITFRDFPEIREYASPSVDKFVIAALALEAAIDLRIRVLRNIPTPSRAAEGERLVEISGKVAGRLMDYKKFYISKNPEKEREY